MYDAGTSNISKGPIANKTVTIRTKDFTFSTCSVVKGPPYISLAKSILEGVKLLLYVKALRRRGYLCFLAKFNTLKTVL